MLPPPPPTWHEGGGRGERGETAGGGLGHGRDAGQGGATAAGEDRWALELDAVVDRSVVAGVEEAVIAGVYLAVQVRVPGVGVHRDDGRAVDRLTSPSVGVGRAEPADLFA